MPSAAASPSHLPRPLARPPRSDGEQSRQRLRQAALALFAQHGFAKTSTRAIVRSAGTNVAAISYHFGDKAGLYRAVFSEPLGSAPAAETRARVATNDPADPPPAPPQKPPLAQALATLYAGFIEPLRHGDAARQCMKLHMREALEPSGLWEHDAACGFEAQHRGLLALLCGQFGLRRADAELHRLALCLTGLGVQLHVGRDLADAVAPGLNRGPKALGLWQQRLVAYALAMIESERRRRAGEAA